MNALGHDGDRPGYRGEKNLIESAYQTGAALGLAVWTQDEAGPYQTRPYVGASWQLVTNPAKQPHEYFRDGTAKLLTLFHPASGQVRVKGVTRTTNAVLHPWLKGELLAILQTLPENPPLEVKANRLLWERWQTGLSLPITLSQQLPALRILLIWDNLKGHHTPDQIITLLEGVAHGWNQNPTPFEWGGTQYRTNWVGKRRARRQRSRQRLHMLGGSGACTRRPIRRRSTLIQQWQS